MKILILILFGFCIYGLLEFLIIDFGKKHKSLISNIIWVPFYKYLIIKWISRANYDGTHGELLFMTFENKTDALEELAKYKTNNEIRGDSNNI